MPSCAGLIRLLRRRIVLALIFTLSLTYCAFSLIRNEKKASLNLNNHFEDVMDHMMINDNNENLIPDDNMFPEELKASDKWQMEILDSAVNKENIEVFNESDASTQLCHNSIQGKGLIVDERGIVCSRREILPNGCCKIEHKQISVKKEETLSLAMRERYSCKTCNPQGCCMIYEYCVSCCLHPNKQLRGRKIILLAFAKAQKNEEKPHNRNLDRFQICLAICRTSSSSVQHENIYKDPHAKYCYTSNSHQRHQRNINSLNNNGESPAVVVTSSSVVALLTHLSPEYHSSYRLPNESRIPIRINVIYFNCVLTLLDYHTFEIHIE